ncbi:hypothetical protein [Paenibacillus vini]|uniref:Uncharacterized protein n=1 Tax=Paenibacillus vini TaxID=1476024 RepID=A0ABQ4MH18_9BACL|nr:hypothetical protein [Paenibacillus vini]GIP55252.1 hypothetical protein J42TS3_42870 [Paenibacillus vini]
MAQNVTLADHYITANCADIEDWTEADAAKRQRMLNVAERTLIRTYPKYTVPDAAVYEFANVLTIAFNDTNRLARQGITGFSVTGVANFDFKDAYITGPDADLRKLIPQTAIDLIGAENGITLSKRRVGWVTL